MVVAQLAERSLPTPEIRSLNPDIGNVYIETYLSVNCYPKKTKIKKERPGMAHFKNEGLANEILTESADDTKSIHQIVGYEPQID